MKRICIDRNRPLAEEPHTGHNRFHPGIAPICAVAPGEEILLETRDAFDGQLPPGSDDRDIARMDGGRVHPLTGPLWIEGAAPGDGLEIEFLDITPEAHGVSCILPGFGLLRDRFPDPYLVHWRIADGWATAERLPGIRVPGAPFLGVSAVAPSAALLERWSAREQRLAELGGGVQLPDACGAVPGGACGAAGLRTIPPRENGGNFDVRQLTRGARLTLPVYVDGALFSAGDAHFAQGDGEVCATAIEVGATVRLRFRLHKGWAADRPDLGPVFELPAQRAVGEALGAMGMPITAGGENRCGDLELASRNALLNLMDLLGARGYEPEQAYVICSVAADLRLSNVVNSPNFVVSALLPRCIFL